jgi:hypothetical protein
LFGRQVSNAQVFGDKMIRIGLGLGGVTTLH